MNTQTETILPDWAVVEVAGADARVFLHQQLTQDVLSMDAQQARLFAWCSAKGRVLVSGFIAASSVASGAASGAETSDAFFLLMPSNRVAAMVQRLKSFVLRSRCTVVDASARWQVVGEWHSVAAESTQFAPPLLRYEQLPWQALAQATNEPSTGWAMELPPVPCEGGLWARRLRVEARRSDEAGSDTTTSTTDTDMDADLARVRRAHWARLQVASGVFIVDTAHQDAFVPQMLNYESLGAVHFQKGCYPGQEVVARSQFRGQIKRRTRIVRAAQALAQGADIVDSGGVCGVVTQFAPDDGDGGYALAVLAQDANASALRVGAITLEALSLPYLFREDI